MRLFTHYTSQVGLNVFKMETRNSPRYRIIKNVMTLQREAGAVDTAIRLWQQMADQIISMVGENGFNSLYARSVLIARDQLPGLAAASHLPQAESLFAELKNSLKGKTLAQINEANYLLMVTLPGLHSFRISKEGIRIFPRGLAPENGTSGTSVRKRVATGSSALDEMLGGGLPCGYALLVAGPSGAGKTILAREFLAEGVRRDEPGVIVAFEQTPSQLLGEKLDGMIKAGKIGVINTRSLDLSIDEITHDMIGMIKKMGAKRVVIDSLRGFELALALQFREDFRGALFRMIEEITDLGVTVIMTSEPEAAHNTDLRFSPFGGAFLVDAIIVQCYIEIESRIKRALSVVKVRGSQHSKDVRLYEITDDGITIGEMLPQYAEILSGHPRLKQC